MDDSNLTALHLAAYYGKEAVAAQLLQAWASVSAVDNVYYQTPLHIAALNGKSSIANLLLQANASPTAVNKNGRTPAQYAKQQGYGVSTVRRFPSTPLLFLIVCIPTSRKERNN